MLPDNSMVLAMRCSKYHIYCIRHLQGCDLLLGIHRNPLLSIPADIWRFAQRIYLIESKIHARPATVVNQRVDLLQEEDKDDGNPANNGRRCAIFALGSLYVPVRVRHVTMYNGSRATGRFPSGTNTALRHHITREVWDKRGQPRVVDDFFIISWKYCSPSPTRIHAHSHLGHVVQ